MTVISVAKAILMNEIGNLS